MQLFFNEETNIYRTMFCRESKKSVTGLEVLDNFVRQIQDTVESSNNIHEIQKSIRMLSIFCDILQTFNTSIESLVSSIDKEVYDEVMAKSPNAICLRVKDWATDLSSYQINDKFTGVVSYVMEGDSKLCFIKDLTNQTNQNFKPYVESEFDGIPNYGEIFGLEMRQTFFRAIRIDTEATGMTIRVRLIDNGEIISVSPNSCKFNLKEEAKKVRPLAMLSRIEKVDGKIVNTLSGLYNKVFVVKIKDIYVNMLEVELQTVEQNSFEVDLLHRSIMECIEVTGDDQQPLSPLSSLSPLSPPPAANGLNPISGDIIDPWSSPPANKLNSIIGATTEPMVARPVNNNPFLNDFEETTSLELNHTKILNGYNGQTLHSPEENSLQNDCNEQTFNSNQGKPLQKTITPMTTIHPDGMKLITIIHADGTKGQVKVPLAIQRQYTQPRPDLPPIPPRQPKQLTPLRIPIGLIRRNQSLEEKKPDNKDYANHMVMKYANGEVKMTHASQQNEINYKICEKEQIQVNGKKPSQHVEKEQNYDQCSCETGAHPKPNKNTHVQESNCLHSHIPRDVLSIPMNGEEKSVVPTHLINAEYLYVQYSEWVKQFEDFQFGALQQVERRQLSYIPKINDLVLARYNDQFVYRGRINKIEQHTVSVFYVDYGNSEVLTYDDLFEWDDMCDIIPFQAAKYRIANIRSLPGRSSKDIQEYIRINYINQTCKARVLSVSDDWILATFVNTNGLDIVEEVRSALFSQECIV